MKKKIAIVDPVGQKAGIDYYSLGLLNGLSNLNISTYLFSNIDKPKKSKVINYKFFDSFLENKVIKAYKLIIGHLRSFYICKKEKVDYVIMHVFSVQLIYFLFFILARLFRFKLIVIAHDVTSLANDDNIMLRKWLYRYISSHIIVHNKHSLSELKKITKKTNYTIIQQGSYPELVNDNINYKNARQKLKFDDDKTYILFFGQIKKAKRLDLLIESMQYLNDEFVLVIAGKPWKDDFSIYEDQIKLLNLHNRIQKNIRFITDEEREYFFKACDVMVLPYEKIYQSAVLLMAMTYGMAIIASDIAPFKEVITNGKNGLLFEQNNAKDLSLHLNNLFTDKLKLKKIKEQSIISANTDFSWNNIAIKYKETFNL